MQDENTEYKSQYINDLRNQVKDLHDEILFLEKRIGDASMLIADWDGYYNPDTKSGNTERLAMLIEDCFKILQGKSWRDSINN